ncbi:hypothetical protein EGW08_021201 [Elysia chlorotica]|uniref:SWIM-type domain-containing protein n=1 Tax=Elysia chlorotica TaxID=188477 RepID=A0A433SP55_ELYCH|nr:hypothetical protein EGW08_021201 [Elysia chlorotica]
MWAKYKNLDVLQLTVTTTNHLEFYHGKIKSFMNTKMSLSEALEVLNSYDNMLLRAANANSTMEAIKTRYNSKDSDATIREIYGNLTTFAAKLVVHQYQISKKIAYSVETASNPTRHVVNYSADMAHTTTVAACSCKFFINLKLQCRHIFALRQYFKMCIYEKVSSGHRFSRNMPPAPITPLEGYVEECPVVYTSKTLTVEGKFLKAANLMNDERN